jgi:probable Rubsico expression protein CbbX
MRLGNPASQPGLALAAIGRLPFMVMRGRVGNRVIILVLLAVSVIFLVIARYALPRFWFAWALAALAFIWLMVGVRLLNSRYANREPGASPSPRAGTRPPAPPANTDRRPGSGPGETSRPRRFPGRTARSQQGGLLSPDAKVTLAAEREAAGVDDVFAALDRDLVGLMPVKQKVEEIAALLLVDRVRHRFGLDAPRPNLHMCFTGPPGTGKTTVALRMADLLHRLGYLETGQLVHAMRDDLVGEFIGQTAPRTKQVLERAMGGVLFIDEAYYLYRSHDSKDYGQEAIDILLQVMENEREKLVVILAGYKDRMDEFFGSNPGMSSRIAHHLDFAAYRLDELMAISRVMLGQAQYYLSDEAEAAFGEYLRRRMQQPRFAYARSVRNELERARLRHAHRLASDPDRHRNRDDLMRIEPPDVLSSPVFAAAPLAAEPARPRGQP